MPTVQQLPAAVAVNLTDEVMLDQGGNSVAATVAQVLDALPLGTGLVRGGDTLAADTTVLAPLASPALTGTPSAPTPAAGDNSTRLATTAFVAGAIGGDTLTLTGDVTGAGAGTIETMLASIATAGTYQRVTVDTKGRVTAGGTLGESDIAAALGYTPLAGNQTITLAGDIAGSGTTAIIATLPDVGTAGTYQRVTVDAKGRVTAGGTLGESDITAALGYTPLGGNQTVTLTGDVSGSGATAITATLPNIATAGTYERVTVDAKGRVTAGGTLGESDIATALGYTPLAGNQTITLAGDVSGSGTTAITATLPDIATAGTYQRVTVDAKGRVTAGGTLGEADITTALGFTPLAGNQTITLTGDISGSGATAISATLPAVVTPGAYAKVSVDAKGRVIAGGTLGAADLTGVDLSGADATANGGSTARTLAARAHDVVNVLDYGADATGAADSDAAFTAAMTAIASGAWGRVFVPRGTYKLASAVNQPSGRSIAVVFDDGATITGAGYLGVDRVESTQGPFAFRQNSGGFFGFAPTVGDAQNPGFATDLIFNTPQNSRSMRVGWDRRYTNTNVYGKVHSGIDIAEQQIHSWPNLYDNSSGWGLWEVIEGTTLDEGTAARGGLSTSAEYCEIDVVNNAHEAGWTWQSGMANAVQGMSVDPWGLNGNYGGNILYTYGTVGSYDGGIGGLNQRWFCYPAAFSAPNPPAVVAGTTIIVNGTTITLTAGQSLASIAAAINAAAINDVGAAANTWGGVQTRLVIYSNTANDLGTLTLAGTALAALGFAAGSTTTPRNNYAAVVGTAGSVAVGDKLVANGTTVTVGGAGVPSDVAAAINGAGLAGIAADTNANGVIVVTCYMPLQSGGLVLANASGDTTLNKIGLAPGTYLPPTPPKAFATAYSDQTSPVCLPTDQITISATDINGTMHGPVTVTLNGGDGSAWPQAVAASIAAALTAAGCYSADFTALSSGSAVVAVRAVGIGANQGVQIRNTAGGTLILANANGAALDTLGIAPGTYQPGGYSAGSQTVFMAAEDAIAAGGRGVFIGGVSDATDLTVYPHTPMEARGGFLHGLRLDRGSYDDSNAVIVAPAHAIAWGSAAQGQHRLAVSSGTLEFDGAPIVNSGAFDAAFGSEVGDLLVRTASGWATLAPGAQGELLTANGPGTPLSWVQALPNQASGTVLATSGTAGVATTITSSAILDGLGSTFGDMLHRGASGWLALSPGATGQVLQSGGPGAAPSWAAASALHEKYVLSIHGTLAANTQYWTLPVADPAIIPAGWNAPSSVGACGIAPGAGTTVLTIAYLRGGTSTTIGTISFTAESTVANLTGPSAAIALQAGDVLTASTGASVDATLANIGFTMVATKE